MGGTSASAPLREFAEDSVPSSEGIGIALASDTNKLILDKLTEKVYVTRSLGVYN